MLWDAPVNRKRLLIDAIGFSSLIPFFLLYNHVEQSRPGYLAVLVSLIAYLPVAAVWHHFYRKFSTPA